MKYEADMFPNPAEYIPLIPPSKGLPDIGSISDGSGYTGNSTGKSSFPNGIRFVE